MTVLRSCTTALVAVLVALGTPVPAGAGTTDDTPPVLTITGLTWRTFYPVADGFKDTTDLEFSMSDDSGAETLEVHLEVTDAAGRLVLQRVDRLPARDLALGWDGRDGAGRPLPAGAHTLTLWAVDPAGNASDPQARTVTLSRQRLVTRTFRRHVRASRSVVERHVGRCSRLLRPARPAWAGSLGYRSGVRCRGGSAAGEVATINGVYVPRAHAARGFGSFYRSLVVTGRGGADRSRPGSRAMLQYWNQQDRRWFARSRLGHVVGSHAARRVRPGRMIRHDEDGNPYLLWGVLARGGSRYDVRSFTVQLRYQVLTGASPGGPAPGAPPAPPALAAWR